MQIINEQKFHYAYYRQFGYTPEQAIKLHNDCQKLAIAARQRMEAEELLGRPLNANEHEALMSY